MLKKLFPELKIRFVNVLNLFTLTPNTEHPDGLSDREFDSYFTKDKPVIFNFHGYPWLIHRPTYRRNNHKNIHVRGYREIGRRYYYLREVVAEVRGGNIYEDPKVLLMDKGII